MPRSPEESSLHHARGADGESATNFVGKSQSGIGHGKLGPIADDEFDRWESNDAISIRAARTLRAKLARGRAKYKNECFRTKEKVERGAKFKRNTRGHVLDGFLAPCNAGSGAGLAFSSRKARAACRSHR